MQMCSVLFVLLFILCCTSSITTSLTQVSLWWILDCVCIFFNECLHLYNTVDAVTCIFWHSIVKRQSHVQTATPKLQVAGLYLNIMTTAFLAQCILVWQSNLMVMMWWRRDVVQCIIKSQINLRASKICSGGELRICWKYGYLLHYYIIKVLTVAVITV